MRPKAPLRELRIVRGKDATRALHHADFLKDCFARRACGGIEPPTAFDEMDHLRTHTKLFHCRSRRTQPTLRNLQHQSVRVRRREIVVRNAARDELPEANTERVDVRVCCLLRARYHLRRAPARRADECFRGVRR